MGIRIEVGGPGFISTFRSPSGLTGRYLMQRAALLIGAAKRDAPVLSGDLKASIHATISYGPTGDLMARVGSDLPYAELVDRGTPPHIIRPKNGQVLRFVTKQGEVVYARSVRHPGTDPNHFLTDNLPIVLA